MLRSIAKPLSIALGLFLAVYGAAAVKKVAFINQAKCIKCGTCAKVCPTKAPKKTEEDGVITSVVIDVKKCVVCSTCVKKCPRKAISLVDPKDIVDGTFIQISGGDSTAGKKAAIATEKSTEAKQSKKAAASEKQ